MPKNSASRNASKAMAAASMPASPFADDQSAAPAFDYAAIAAMEAELMQADAEKRASKASKPAKEACRKDSMGYLLGSKKSIMADLLLMGCEKSIIIEASEQSPNSIMRNRSILKDEGRQVLSINGLWIFEGAAMPWNCGKSAPFIFQAQQGPAMIESE